MTVEERKSNIDDIHKMIPEYIFTSLCNVLTQMGEENRSKDLIIGALGRVCRRESSGFAYVMKITDNKDTITPVREILDLLDGWLISSKLASIAPRTRWEVDSIVCNKGGLVIENE